MPSLAHDDGLPAPLLTTALVLALAAQEPSSEAEVRFDLRALELLARTHFEQLDLRRPLEDPYLNALEFTPLDVTLDDDGAEVEQLWRSFAPALASQFAGRRLEAATRGHELVLRGDWRARSATRRALEVLEHWLARAWQVEVHSLPPEACAALTGAVLDAAGADALLARSPPLDSAHLVATTRRAASLRSGAVAPFLQDYETLVTREGVALTDPQVFVTRSGLEAAVWVATQVDGRVLVSAAARAATPGASRPWQPLGAGHAPVEHASGVGARWVGSAWLCDGGAFVLSGADAGALLVRVRGIGSRAAPVDDVAYLGLGAGDRARVQLPAPFLGGHDERHTVREEEVAPGLDLGALLAELRDAAAPHGPAFVARLGSEALAAGAPAALAAVRAHAARRLAPFTRTFTVDVRVGEVARDLAIGLQVGQALDSARGASSGSPLGALLSRSERHLGAVALGDTLDLTCARTWLVPLDLALLDAGEHRVGESLFGAVDHGTALRARLAPRSGGALGLALTLHRRWGTPPPFPTRTVPSFERVAASGATEVLREAEVERPVVDDLGVTLDTLVPLDTWIVAGLEPSATTPGSMHLVCLRVSEASPCR